MKSVQIWSFFWFVFSRIRTEYGPEKLRIWTLFTQCQKWGRRGDAGLPYQHKLIGNIKYSHANDINILSMILLSAGVAILYYNKLLFSFLQILLYVNRVSIQNAVKHKMEILIRLLKSSL